MRSGADPEDGAPRKSRLVKALVSKPFIPPCLQKPAPQREKRRTDRIPAPPGKGFPAGCPEQSPRRRAPAPAIPRSRSRAEQLSHTHSHTHAALGAPRVAEEEAAPCRSLGATVIYSETEQAARSPGGGRHGRARWQLRRGRLGAEPAAGAGRAAAERVRAAAAALYNW